MKQAQGLVVHSELAPEARERPGFQERDCWANLTIRKKGGSISLRITKRGDLEVDSFPNGQCAFNKDDAPDVIVAIQEFLGSL